MPKQSECTFNSLGLAPCSCSTRALVVAVWSSQYRIVGRQEISIPHTPREIFGVSYSLFSSCLVVLSYGGKSPAPPIQPGSDTSAISEASPPQTADEEVVLDLTASGEPLGELFETVNLDAAMNMSDAEDYDRLARLMCPAWLHPRCRSRDRFMLNLPRRPLGSGHRPVGVSG